MGVRLETGDCLQILPRLRRERLLVDAVVTDPPYHLTSIVDRLGKPGSAPIQSGATGVYARSSSGFMGKEWDGGDVAFQPETWAAVAGVMKPGAHLIAFGGTRTYHRLACAIEDAGFEIRDQIGWLYGTGFPKSHNLEGDWGGWGTALKPAWEPIVLARKPSGLPVPESMERYGVGAINVDGCRVPHAEQLRAGSGGIPCRHDPAVPRGRTGEASADRRYADRGSTSFSATPGPRGGDVKGRWPANVIHDGSDEVLDAFAAFGERGAQAPVHRRGGDKFRNTFGEFKGNIDEAGSTFRGDSGTAARFFYSAKATTADRAGSKHPTVKPVDLIAYLCRLVTPPGGLVLDPFAGSGTTGAAAQREGFDALLIEREPEYIAGICRRFALSADEMRAASVSSAPSQISGPGPLFTGAAA